MYKTKCSCGGDLHVTEITMAETGRILQINVPLEKDGFEFDPNDVSLKDWSTENEQVTCQMCKTTTSLETEN
jgi:hypothetical protein